MPCKAFLDFSVSWNWLRGFVCRIVVPVVIRAVPEEYATLPFKGSDQIESLHLTTSSPTLRTPGIFPLVSSL